MKNHLSVVYAVYNEEANLARSLESVVDFADEIIIVDGQSTDDTTKIAKKFGAKIISTTNKPNFHLNKQMAIDAAKGELILQLDADEVVDRQLRAFILQQLKNGPSKVAAWQLKRKNLFFATFLTKGGQYPDPVIRLFWRGQAFLPANDVHEQMQVQGKLATANGHLLHYANPDLSCYLRKFNTYTSFKAQQLQEAQLPLTAFNYWFYTWWLPGKTFFSLFIRHRGYVDGWAGFLFAFFSGLHHRVAFFKYVEATRNITGEGIRVYFPTSKIDKFQVHRGVGRYRQWLLEAFREKKILPVSQPDCSEIHHYLFFDLYRRALKKPPVGQKLVITVHDLIPLIFPEHYPVGWRGKLAFKHQRRYLQRADLIIADSQATKNDLEKIFHLNKDKIKVVYLAANPNLSLPSKVEIEKTRKELNLPAKYLLYVGDINYNKNLPQLIKALKFLPSELELVMVGKNFTPSPIVEWQNIQEQLDLSMVRSRVHFFTNIKDDKLLSAIYAGAIAYVQPSLYEGFGLPILEAYRCGCLVVCPKNSSLPEVAGRAAFYANSCQAQELANTIKRVLKLSESAKQKHLEAGFAQERQFSWQQTAEQVQLLYTQLLAEA